MSGAFNLAAALKESLSGIGVFYFAVCFISILVIWTDKVGIDSRFVIHDNLTLRGIELLKYCVLGTAVQHIRSVETMSRTSENSTMLIFSASLACNHVIQFVQDVDVFLHCDGGREAQMNARNDMYVRIPAFLLTCLACTWCLMDSYSHDEASSLFNHGPAVLLLLAYVSAQVSTVIVRFVVVVQQKRSHKESFVPLNIEHTIHRLGEWIVLMLGESILALLIVEQSPGQRYYVTFYSGIITVTLLQYLFFRSNPFDPDDHAMRRSSEGAFMFYYAIVFYSASLIMVGCSFKMILHFYLELEEAGGEIDDLELQQTSQAIANLYSWSAAASFVFLDLMLISHRGVASTFGRLVHHDGKCANIPTLIMITDLSLTLFQAVLSQWVQNLEVITVIGLGVVFGHVFIRTHGLKYFPVSRHIA